MSAPDPSAGSGGVLHEALSRRPDLAQPLADLLAALRAGPVEAELLGACEAVIRHRIGVPVAVAIPDVGGAELDARARAVLTMAEQFAVDAHGIGTEMRDAVLDHCSLAELATLVQAFAVFDALARMEAVLDPAPERR